MFTLKNFKKVSFPKDFIWGSATSAYQVEGNNTKNQWYQFEQEEGNIANGDRCGMATNHYELFEQDFDLAVELNHNSHRVGIEWSRLCPEAPDKFDRKEIEHYRQVFKAMRGAQYHGIPDPASFYRAGMVLRCGQFHAAWRGEGFCHLRGARWPRNSAT